MVVHTLAPSPDRGLTPRQTQCLALAAHGWSSARIGAALALSPRTVDDHLARACDRLGVRTRIQAVAVAIALGQIPSRRTPPPSLSASAHPGARLQRSSYV